MDKLIAGQQSFSPLFIQQTEKKQQQKNPQLYSFLEN